MKVVHTGHAPILPGHPDHGKFYYHPGRWALNLAIAQKKYTELNVEFVTQVPGASANYSTTVDGVPLHYIAAPDRLRAATFFALDVRRISRSIRDLKPDVVHAHGTEEAYALAAQACECPHVITAQGCFFIINRELPPRWISRARLVEFTERFAFRRANHVIAKSRYVRDELARAFPHLSLHEIPNTIDPSLLDIPADRPRRWGHLAFVGTVVVRKGVHLIADALEHTLLATHHSPPITLHIFGNRENPTGYEKEVLERLRMILGNHLILHGNIPNLQVAEELSTMDILLAPSLEEMFGNQLIEALIVGCQAIVAENTALAENLKRFGGGTIIPQRDPQSMAEAMLDLLQERAESDRHTKPREAVLSLLGPQIIAAQHLGLYQDILAVNPSVT